MPEEPMRSTSQRKQGAFSLVELLAVMAIIVIMLTLLAPAINSVSSTAGRKGAINILMNTFEQARAAALETGVNVYVVLWQREFPEHDSIIVLRDPLPWDKKETTTVQLTKWIALPQGVLLYNPHSNGSNNIFASQNTTLDMSALPQASAKDGPTGQNTGVLQFSPTGVILQPSNKQQLRVIVGEGVRGTGGSVALLTPKKEQGLFDVITFRRFTGRPSLDVSSL